MHQPGQRGSGGSPEPNPHENDTDRAEAPDTSEVVTEAAEPEDDGPWVDV